MKQAEFERRGEPLWHAFAEQLAVLEADRTALPSPSLPINTGKYAKPMRSVSTANTPGSWIPTWRT